jgi:hypothetical protein
MGEHPTKRKNPLKVTRIFRGFLGMRLAATYSPTGEPAVPSALWGLTAVFGMGTGVSPTLKPPTTYAGPLILA